MTNHLTEHYPELKFDKVKRLWDGDMSQIPEPGTLVAMETASRGLVNVVVTGYGIRHWREEDGSYNKALIDVKLVYPDSSTDNCRMLHDLHLPLTVREKGMLKKIETLEKKSNGK